MELRQLRYFAAVADELHFSRAAQRLDIAQPALSHQIRQLERELGVELFARTTRVVDLTAAGRVLADEAHSILECTERISAAVRSDNLRAGTLRVGAVPTALSEFLPALLRAFHLRAPHVKIELQGAPSRGQVEALRAGELDAGVVYAPLDADDMASQALLEEEIKIAMPADHPLAESDRLPLAAFADEPFVMFPRAKAPALHDELTGHCLRRGFTPRIAYEVPGMSEALAVVAAGLGVALLPASFAAQAVPGAVLRPMTTPVPTMIMLMIWRRGGASPALRVLGEAAREVAGKPAASTTSSDAEPTA